jgi:hypothetical protein
MSNVKISALSAATALAGTEVAPIVQGGATVAATVQQIVTAATGATVMSGATVTTSKPLVDLAQTWNAGGVIFEGYSISITETAAAVYSKLCAVKSGGVIGFSVRGAAVPYVVAENGWGFMLAPSGASVSGRHTWTATGIHLPSDARYGFSSGTDAPGSADDTGLSRNAAGVVEVNNGTAGTYRDLKLRHEIATGLFATAAAAPTIASAGTIAPTTPIAFISGTATISTITAPSPISAGGGQITLIPTGLWATNTAGNIALATTAVVNKALTLTFDTTTGKWYPSY